MSVPRQSGWEHLLQHAAESSPHRESPSLTATLDTGNQIETPWVASTSLAFLLVATTHSHWGLANHSSTPILTLHPPTLLPK